MPNTITPDDDVAVTSAIASMRRHIALKLATVTADLPEPPEALRQQIEAAAASIKRMTAGSMPLEYHCLRDGHRLIPETGDLFVCSICPKRFRLVA